VSLDSTARRGPRAHPIAGIVALGESASPLRLGFLALILVGIVGLKLVDG
jgi:multidrug transporter EmrE-like cation transporter